MDLESFKDALDELGIDHYEAGSSIVLKDCPTCGSNKFKVHIRNQEENGLFFGRCYAGSCQTNYSSIKYLLLAGMPYFEVMRVHGKDPEEALKNLTPNPFTEEPKAEKVKEEGPVDTDISAFFRLKDWMDHPAAKYAVKRGALPEWEDVMIDHQGCAVVFVAREAGQVVGYQRRFLYPDNPHTKAKTSLGFQKTNHILEFPRDGADILVCEGPFTAISAYHYGYYGICTFGSGVSDKQVEKIIKLSERLGVKVGVAYDEDEAGLKGYNRIRSSMYWLNKHVFRVKPEIGNDLNDSWQAGGRAILCEEKFEYNPAIPELKRFI